MVNTNIILTIIFALVASGWFYFTIKKGKRAERYGPLVLLHTQKGVKTIDNIANLSPRFWKIFSAIGIVVAFFFMVNGAYGIYSSALHIIKTPAAQAGAALVLPGIEIMGVKIPVLGWLFAVIILLFSHEMSHGIIARAEKINVQSVGALLLGFLPIGAFVKPDEKRLAKEKTIKQLKIFAAGSFMNIIVALLCIAIILFILLPAATASINGIKITAVDNNSPAYNAGIQPGMSITAINGEEIRDWLSFNNIWLAKNFKAGDEVVLKTDAKEEISLVLADRGDGKGRAGIVFCGKGIEKMNREIAPFMPFVLTAHQKACQSAATTSDVLLWASYEIILWAAIINMGVGVINLLPIKPLDGGLMVEAVVKKFVRTPKISAKIVTGVTLIFLLFLLINILGPYVRILFVYLKI